MGFGATPAGQQWCMKALHPSDELQIIDGIPDQNGIPGVMFNYNQMTELSCAAAATGSWDVDITLTPTPEQFAIYNLTDSTGTTIGPVFNSQLGAGASLSAARTAWLAMCEAWRMCYMSATVRLNATSTTDSGMLVAAQYVVKPKKMSCAFTTGGGVGIVGQAFNVWQTADVPVYASLMSMPNAFAGKAKDGCYMPIKLRANHQLIRSGEDYTSQGLTVAAGNGYQFPIAGTQAGWPWGNSTSTYISGGTSIAGDQFPPFCNDTVGAICIKGLNPLATVTIEWHVGFQALVQPLTTNAGFQRVPPEHDPLAVDQYYRIVRQLKDGYPAAYNDWNGLWNVLKGVAQKVLPIVGAFGPIGAAVSGLGSGIIGGVDAITEAVARRKSNRIDKPPAALTQAAADYISAPKAPPLPVRGPQMRRTINLATRDIAFTRDGTPVGLNRRGQPVAVAPRRLSVQRRRAL